jgi:hypothetical protein
MNFVVWTLYLFELFVWIWEFEGCLNELYFYFYFYFYELCMNFRVVWIICMYLCLDGFIFIIIEIVLSNEPDELNFTRWTNSSQVASCKWANELARFLTRRSWTNLCRDKLTRLVNIMRWVRDWVSSSRDRPVGTLRYDPTRVKY